MPEEKERQGTLTILQGRVAPNVVKRLLGADFLFKPSRDYNGDLAEAHKQQLMKMQ